MRDGNNATVGFWLDTNGAGTAPAAAVACNSQVKITLATDDTAATVATKVASAIDAQASWLATAAGTVVTVTAAANGVRSAPSASTSTFTVTETQVGVAAGTLEVTTVFADEELDAIQHVQQNDVMYLTHPLHPPQMILKAATGWLIARSVVHNAIRKCWRC